MIDTRAAYDSLLTSPKLDSLLAKAKEQTEKLSQSSDEPNLTQTVAQIDEKVAEVNQMQVHAREDLQEILRQRNEKRAEKAAIAAHITRVVVKLVS